MRVLILGYVWPEPNSTAAGTRMMELIDVLGGAGWELHFASAATPTEHQADLSDWGVESFTVALNCDSFNHQVAELAPDIVIFDRFFTEEQFGWRVSTACPQALQILDTEDLHSLRAARERLHRTRQKTLSNAERDTVGPVAANAGELFDAMRSDDLILRELAALYRVDLSLMISDFEMQLLQSAFGVPPELLFHLPFMLADKPSPAPGFSGRAHFVSIGNFRHAPNWDAVLWLKHDLWPAIRRQVPGAQLHIYGAYPPRKATALHNPREGFWVKGWAEDALTVMAGARVCLAPLRFGAGIKGKLIDAMRTRTPSVTTGIGAEAMTGDLPWPGAVADGRDDFARQAARLYQNADHWQSASDNAAAVLDRHYRRDYWGPFLLNRLTELQANLDEHRHRNILGALFNYHSLRSTEFMSRWIEGKKRLNGRGTGNGKRGTENGERKNTTSVLRSPSTVFRSFTAHGAF